MSVEALVHAIMFSMGHFVRAPVRAPAYMGLQRRTMEDGRPRDQTLTSQFE